MRSESARRWAYIACMYHRIAIRTFRRQLPGIISGDRSVTAAQDDRASAADGGSSALCNAYRGHHRRRRSRAKALNTSTDCKNDPNMMRRCGSSDQRRTASGKNRAHQHHRARKPTRSHRPSGQQGRSDAFRLHGAVLSAIFRTERIENRRRAVPRRSLGKARSRYHPGTISRRPQARATTSPTNGSRPRFSLRSRSRSRC